MKFKTSFLILTGFCLIASLSRSEDECRDCQVLVNGVCRQCYQVQRECVIDVCITPAYHTSEQIAKMKAAAKGNAAGQWYIANQHDMNENYKKAFSWYQKAADNGHSFAQFCLGRMYEDGRGVAKDLVRAIGWYRKAADGGYQGARCHLGSMYETGVGVARDYSEAVRWYTSGAARSPHGTAEYTVCAKIRVREEALRCYADACWEDAAVLEHVGTE